MEKFPHLQFKQKVTGHPRFPRFGEENPRSKTNKEQREEHGNYLQSITSYLKKDWENSLDKRKGLPEIDESFTPVFLQINPEILRADFDLESFGIEIISEESEGFIIGAAADKLSTLESKIAGFIKEDYGTGKIADLWSIVEGKREDWKPRHILSDHLFSRWNEIADDEIINVEVSIAFAKPIPKEPDIHKFGGEARHQRYIDKLVERDDMLMGRQTHF